VRRRPAGTGRAGRSSAGSGPRRCRGTPTEKAGFGAFWPRRPTQTQRWRRPRRPGRSRPTTLQTRPVAAGRTDLDGEKAMSKAREEQRQWTGMNRKDLRPAVMQAGARSSGTLPSSDANDIPRSDCPGRASMRDGEPRRERICAGGPFLSQGGFDVLGNPVVEPGGWGILRERRRFAPPCSRFPHPTDPRST